MKKELFDEMRSKRGRNIYLHDDLIMENVMKDFPLKPNSIFQAQIINKTKEAVREAMNIERIKIMTKIDECRKCSLDFQQTIAALHRMFEAEKDEAIL